MASNYRYLMQGYLAKGACIALPGIATLGYGESKAHAIYHATAHKLCEIVSVRSVRQLGFYTQTPAIFAEV
jgi:hypothetical protein